MCSEKSLHLLPDLFYNLKKWCKDTHFLVICKLRIAKYLFFLVFLHPNQEIMAILHLFNPEHDIAMASNLSNFTAPHAGRQLRQDLDFLPAIWAASDDYVLVGNADDAQTAFSRLM